VGYTVEAHDAAVTHSEWEGEPAAGKVGRSSFTQCSSLGTDSVRVEKVAFVPRGSRMLHGHASHTLSGCPAGGYSRRLGKRGQLCLIPRLVDQDAWAQLRRPMDMIRQG
jgi:hypothetical protein